MTNRQFYSKIYLSIICEIFLFQFAYSLKLFLFRSRILLGMRLLFQRLYSIVASHSKHKVAFNNFVKRILWRAGGTFLTLPIHFPFYPLTRLKPQISRPENFYQRRPDFRSNNPRVKIHKIFKLCDGV